MQEDKNEKDASDSRQTGVIVLNSPTICYSNLFPFAHQIAKWLPTLSRYVARLLPLVTFIGCCCCCWNPLLHTTHRKVSQIIFFVTIRRQW